MRLFRTERKGEQKEKERKELERKKHNEKKNKDNIMRDIRILFVTENEEDFYEPKRINNFQNYNYIKHESNGDKNRNLSLDEYLDKIESYLRNIIISLQNLGTWKIQLTIEINIIYSRDTEEERVMHSNKDNIKFTSYSKVNDFVNELFKSIRAKYQDSLELSMKKGDFIFDSV